MPTHLSFLDDAVETFLEAFELHQSLVTSTPDTVSHRTAVICVRALALALEKGSKHALAGIDPYLLISKLDRNLLIQIRRDLLSRPAPSIFCSRQPFETISLLQCWETLRELRGHTIAPDATIAFDRALARLVAARNRAYHGEVFEELDELISIVDEMFARFASVMSALCPDWVTRLSERNGQILSRLRGIEAKVDAAWQVLVDYLADHGSLHFRNELYCIVPRNGEDLRLLFGASSGRGISASCDLPRALAKGQISQFLTKQQADERYSVLRRLRSEHVGSAPEVESMLFESGTLSLPPTTVRLAFDLEGITPGRLFLNAELSALQLGSTDGGGANGSVSGLLRCLGVRGSTLPSAVRIVGTACLKQEMHMDEDLDDLNDGLCHPEQSVRTFDLDLQLLVAT
jgi:hypothetical protein